MSNDTKELAELDHEKKLAKKYKWKANAQQLAAMDNWINPASETYGNAYKSFIKAGFKDSYARNVMNITPRWLSDYIDKLDMQPEHIKQSLQSIALNPEEYNNSRSPADTRVKSLEVLAKISGMIDKQGGVTFNLVQPILGGKSVNIPTKNTRKDVPEADTVTDVDKLIPED